MEITQKELQQLEKVGQGNFGAVYKQQNQALKAYLDKVKAQGLFGKSLVANPCLRTPSFVFFRNRILNKKLKLTKLAEEKLIINGRFKGVCNEFYDGTTMNETGPLPYQELEHIGKQLIESTQELTTHHIYPLDLKLDNIIIDINGNVHIIDLDDPFTKTTIFPHPTLQKRSIYKLKQVLTIFFHYQHTLISLLTTSLLNNPVTQLKTNDKITYEDLYEYVSNEFQQINLIFLKASSLDQINIEHLRNFINKENTKIVLFDHGEIRSYFLYFENFISYLKSIDLPVYDVIFGEDIDTIIQNYINGHNTINSYNQSFQKIKH